MCPSTSRDTKAVKLAGWDRGELPYPPAGRGPYPYLTLDALVVKCREAGRIVNAHVVHAVSVNADGYRESLGVDVVTSEDGAGVDSLPRGLVARGLSGVKLVTSDAYPGLVDAIAATLPGASWQRCRTHFVRNLQTRVPKSAQSLVATLVRSIFAQPDSEGEREHGRIARKVEPCAGRSSLQMWRSHRRKARDDPPA